MVREEARCLRLIDVLVMRLVTVAIPAVHLGLNAMPAIATAAAATAFQDAP